MPWNSKKICSNGYSTTPGVEPGISRELVAGKPKSSALAIRPRGRNLGLMKFRDCVRVQVRLTNGSDVEFGLWLLVFTIIWIVDYVLSIWSRPTKYGYNWKVSCHVALVVVVNQDSRPPAVSTNWLVCSVVFTTCWVILWLLVLLRVLLLPEDSDMLRSQSFEYRLLCGFKPQTDICWEWWVSSNTTKLLTFNYDSTAVIVGYSIHILNKDLHLCQGEL